MSVFSIIKRGRAQAKEHSAKQTDKDKDETVKLPYKHIPTHAATDAIATAPASWKQDDRSKIREQNRRRSAMAANGMSHSALPRVGSSLANVSYPSVYANPVVPLPKNYSYSSISSAWRERMPSTPEAYEGEYYFSYPGDRKGKGKEIMPSSFMVGTGGTESPVLSSGRTSPLSSRVPVTIGAGAGMAIGMAVEKGSENSGGSEDEGGMRKQPVKNISYNSEPRPPSSHDSSTTGERMHRLHPAHARKISESRALPTSDRHYPPAARSTYFSFSVPRPTSRRGPGVDMSVPSVSGVPGPVYGHAPSSAASSVTSIGMAISTAPTSAASTPPPSAFGDAVASSSQPFQFPAVNMTQATTPATTPTLIRPRRTSLSEYSRTSSDTVRLPSDEPHERSQSQATSIRGRRLSKSRHQQSDETDRSTSMSRIPAKEVPLAKPTSFQTQAVRYEIDRLESKTLYGLYAPESSPERKHTRGKLTKDRSSRKDSDNASTSRSTRWSLFGRSSSTTRA
ncbi:hypothetical protein F5Y14DRAFT_456764 [Nemania sp. NC0429]|nr:hypothetical protein F5Y14DRAFT_456764 [Nemania sp. NC0429]